MASNMFKIFALTLGTFFVFTGCGKKDSTKQQTDIEPIITEPVISTTTYKITVDYENPIFGNPLNRHKKNDDYDRYIEDIADHSPVGEREGKKEREVVLFHFNRKFFSKEVEEEIEKQGYRPLQLEELIALGLTYPNLPKQFPVAAIGSRLGPGPFHPVYFMSPYYHPYIYFQPDKNKFALVAKWIGAAYKSGDSPSASKDPRDQWEENCRFGAVILGKKELDKK